MNIKAEFTVKILKQYAKETGNTVRSTTDLSRLEEWLIIKEYNRLYIPEPPKIEFDTEHDNPF
jgi:hypothetical protein